jgi:gliding motility-associated-like protein
VYDTPGGGRQVLHWVSSGPGCTSDTASALAFSISPNPQAYFSINAASFCTGATIAFADSGSSPGIVTWQWNFGNGTGTQALPFTRTYNNAGIYTTSVRGFTAQGCGSPLFSQVFEILAQPVIDAGPDLTILAGEKVTIQANGSTGAGFTYQWIPGTGLDNPNTLRPVASPEDNTTYVVLATNNGSCAARDSMRILVLKGVQIPNAFSPNGDGLNDVWNIPGLIVYEQSRLSIYDRYGQVIFQSTGYQRPWDGTKAGKPLPVGVYYYLLDLGDGSPRRNGSITLLR